MRRYIATLALLVCCSTLSLADDRSGPGRRTILREGWGTVFLSPQNVRGDYELSINEEGDLHTLTTADGETKIRESGSDLTLTYPDFEAKVDSEPESLTIHWGKDVHTFVRAKNVMTYQGPRGKVVFTRGDHQLEIQGPRGKVLLKDGDGEYTVDSEVGTTRLVTTLSGFKVSGPRLTEHPYLKRGALFSHNGVGIYVELALLDPKNPLFRLLEWDTIVEVETTGP